MVAVSIVITNHNKSGKVRSALASVLDQLDEEDQIVLFDDYSEDDATEVEYERLAKHRKLVTYEKSNVRLGAAGAKNRGIFLATNPVIVLLDADDELTLGAIFEIKKTFESFPDAAVVFGDYFYSSGVLHAPTRVTLAPLADKNGWLDPALLARGGWTLLGTSPFLKSIWSAVGGFDANHPITDDVDFFRKVFLKGGAARYVCEPIYRWNRGADGNSSLATSRIVAWSWVRNWRFYRRFLSSRVFVTQMAQQFLTLSTGRRGDLDKLYSRLLLAWRRVSHSNSRVTWSTIKNYLATRASTRL